MVIISFFQKPEFLFKFTFNNSLLLAIIAAIGAIGGAIIHLLLTKPDREAKRKHDLAQAEYANSQTRLVNLQLDDNNDN